MNSAILTVALAAFRIAVLATKTKIDDQIAAALDAVMGALLARPTIDGWAIANTLLLSARIYAEHTARTGDDLLVGEFQKVAAALEGVIGNEVTAAQIRDVEIPWPYLDAPGVPRAT